MFYSYVMGIDDSILELQQQDFIVESINDNYIISFQKKNYKHGKHSLNKI